MFQRELVSEARTQVLYFIYFLSYTQTVHEHKIVKTVNISCVVFPFLLQDNYDHENFNVYFLSIAIHFMVEHVKLLNVVSL